MGETREIDVRELHLNTLNPRCLPTESERDAIEELIVNQGLSSSNKLLSLAESIAERGLDPTQSIVVKPRDGDGFTVMEGNRRVAAIKLSIDPDLVPGSAGSLRAKFRVLGSSVPRSIPNCYVTDDDEEIWGIIENKHSGQQGGAGTIPWDSEQKARFAERKSGRPDPIISLSEQIYSHFGKDSDVARSLAGVRRTTLERMVRTPYVRNRIGISYSNGRFSYSGDMENELAAMLERLCGASVGVAYDKERRVALVDDVLESIGTQARIPTLREGQDEAPPDSRGVDQGREASDVGQRRTVGHPLRRTSVIPHSHTMQTDGEARIASVHAELKSLDATAYPNAAALLMRTLVQLCVECYLESIGAEVSRNDKLGTKIRRACMELKSHDDAVCQSDIDFLLKFADNKDDIPINRTSLDACTHSRSWSAPPIEAFRQTWDGMSKVIDKMMLACR